MADNQDDPGTVQAYLADGRVDNITSDQQAETQITNYQNAAAADKAIMDSNTSTDFNVSTGEEIRNASARYKAAEFDIQQVKDAESGLAATSTTQPTASVTAVTTTPPPENEGQGASVSRQLAIDTSAAAPTASVAAVTTTPPPENEGQGASVSRQLAIDTSAAQPTASVAAVTTTGYENEGQGASVSRQLAIDSSVAAPTASVAAVTTTPPPENEGQGASVSRQLAIDSSAAAPTATEGPATVSHLIVRGDTLRGLAAKYNINESDILAANRMTITDPNMIYAGRTINIPVAPLSQGIIGNPSLGNEGGTTFGSQTESPENVALDPKKGLMSRFTGRWKA